MFCCMNWKSCFFLNFCLCLGLISHAQFRMDTLLTQPYNPVVIKNFSLLQLPGNFYAMHTGFFCQQELMLEKKFSFPIKIRLGSVSYCDALEGKK